MSDPDKKLFGDILMAGLIKTCDPESLFERNEIDVVDIFGVRHTIKVSDEQLEKIRSQTHFSSDISLDVSQVTIREGHDNDGYHRLVEESSHRIKELEQERDRYKARAKALAKICHDAESKARNMGWDAEDVYDE